MPYYGYGYGYGYGLDPTIFILIPAILFTMYAQFKVSSTTSRYLKVNSYLGYTGEQTARRILDANGLYNVRIEMVRGHLSDHYDPRSNVVRLSQDVYYGKSITSVSVAAHECGHAIQHAKGYLPLQLRSSLVPVVNFASNMSWILIAVGFLMGGALL
jgi:Zn-dependent membrane protease YugP